MASLNQYPRPDFERTKLNWKSLNGPWKFAFDDKDIGLQESWFEDGLSARQVRGSCLLLYSGTSNIAH